MSELIGIFGGTFDPPHLGHLILAAEAQAQLRLDRVLWMLTPQSPFKSEPPAASLQRRLEMLRRAVADNPRFELSTVEVDYPGPYYTADTLIRLREQYPGERLVLLIGGDSLRDFPGWKRPLDILAVVHALGVMRRPGDQIDLEALEQALPGIRAKLLFMDAPRLEIASSTLRQRIRDGGHYRYYLSPAVYDYIQQNRLYWK